MADQARTVGNALSWGASQLRGVADGGERLESEVLLVHATGWERVALLAHPARVLATGQRARFEGLIERRMAAEPVAYLVGEREFYGRPFVVDRRVLIPRPETELLVDLAVASVERWRQRGLEPVVVDVGTGSGAIAVSLAAVAAVRVTGVDVSADAVDVAHVNAERLGQGWRVRLVQGDLLDGLPGPVHVVVANLPYLPEGRRLPRDVSDYEPRVALVAGPSGTELNARLLRMAPPHLAPGAELFLELDGAEQARTLSEVARASYPNAQVAVHADAAGIDRALAVQLA
ncbi:MAG: peptide chain release factor N(5)-glutamine methyltransferase [Chloroflexi bacterium]|nr:peptide chain release factor N(5)-glutamine methyltransferase [Chloroflexota bacterium]